MDITKLIDAKALSEAFPADFVWGVATSAFQIEGAHDVQGKGPSIWDEFCQRPGVIADSSDGRVACDHYHRWASDLDLIANLGVDAYRFSVAWPRVQPEGQGAWNEAGLDFYERLVDGALQRGLKPYMTLYHWDLPLALQHSGGWANRDTVHRFVEFACKMAQRVGDRVHSIATHNEPWVVATLGHEQGIFAPGIQNRATAMQVSHHLLLSHGMAVQALRQMACPAELGIVLNLSPVQAATQGLDDVAQAHLDDGLLLRWYLDPLVKGCYPADVWEFLGADVPQVHDGDAQIIATPIDYLGINYYTRTVSSATKSWDKRSSGLALTDMEWEVYPQGLTELLLRVHRDYQLPALYVMENGAAFKDQYQDGRVQDIDRLLYVARHLAAVGEAIEQGVPVAGYMVWSLLDNFEWASGYAKRFGIVHVDYETQVRTLKDSGRWYQAFLHARRNSQAS